jgi:hypothetical protein
MGEGLRGGRPAGEFMNSFLAGVYCEHCKNTCRLFSV